MIFSQMGIVQMQRIFIKNDIDILKTLFKKINIHLWTKRAAFSLRRMFI